MQNGIHIFARSIATRYPLSHDIPSCVLQRFLLSLLITTVMTYGISSLDFGKVIVLLSCAFNVLMVFLVVTDPAGVIASPYGGGWWDPLKTIADVTNDDNDKNKDAAATHIYPRIWASYLMLQLIVRVNWVFTVEMSPALYRCVLMSYLLPFLQYATEYHVYHTLPSFPISSVAILTVPWLAIIIGYTKYTKEPGKDKKQ